MNITPMHRNDNAQKTALGLFCLCAGFGAWAASVPSACAADRAAKPVISQLEADRTILEEEEVEMGIAENRSRAKLSVAYGGSQDPMIRPRPSKMHDRVTFVIKETTTTAVEAKTTLDTTLSTNMNLQNWFTLTHNSNGDLILKPYSMTTSDGSINTSATGDNYSQIKLDTSTNHSGEGKTNRKNTFTTNLSGEVIEVLPNGHLVVEAKKTIRINGETQAVSLVGRVDPNDLNDQAEVDGERVIDLKIGFSGEGEVTDAIQPGWLSKIVSKFKPF